MQQLFVYLTAFMDTAVANMHGSIIPIDDITTPTNFVFFEFYEEECLTTNTFRLGLRDRVRGLGLALNLWPAVV